ncbi:MAG: sigma-54 dependent transcriptional regulator [Bacteroidota bacterium]
MKILIIDDDSNICVLLERFFTKKGFLVEYAQSAKAGLEKIQKETFNVVLCDYRLPDSDGGEVLQRIKEHDSRIQVIIITGYSDVRMAVSLIKLGAFDYVTKPLFPEEILQTINKALDAPAESSSPVKKSGSAKANSFSFVAGNSESMKDVMNLVNIVAPTNISVLIHGETGSGKEFVARAIHNASKRATHPFIAVDCGAIPRDLAASELFGHIKGAFTSAISNRIGHFEAAHEGTLFLDEIGNLGYDTQVKLLRALQEKIITRVGDSKPIHVDVRIIAATNENLLNAVKEGKFREDLYHRLNEIKIMLPALRNRREDIHVFVRHFINLANQELEKDVKDYEPHYLEVLQAYPWHGNLRELKNVIKRSVLFARGEKLEVSSLPEEIRNYAGTEPTHNFAPPQQVAYSAAYVPPPPAPLSAPAPAAPTEVGDLKSASIQAEKQTILNTLAKVNYNKTKAAVALNIDRKTLYNKIKQFNIELD